VQTWQESKLYVLEPLAYRNETDQGIALMTWGSLLRVLAGFGIAVAVGVPLGMALGSSATFSKMIDPAIQILRPVSPLAWYPIGFAIFLSYNKDWEINVGELAAIFTVAVCAMWPTVLNTAKGVRSIPQDYHNVAKVLGLSGPQKLFKVLLPAAFPDMFTGFRLSLGMAWLVIVAAEMLTAKNGIGGFLNQEFNAGKTEHILLCVITIGLVGFVLDRLMSLAEANTDRLLNVPFKLAAGPAAGRPPRNRRRRDARRRHGRRRREGGDQCPLLKSSLLRNPFLSTGTSPSGTAPTGRPPRCCRTSTWRWPRASSSRSSGTAGPARPR
jgi:nitrate/nitrite transport system permease protein